MTESEMPEKQGHAVRSSKMLAFLGVVFSTCAVTACLICFPLVFHYVQTLQATIHTDLTFCRSRSRDMWKQVLDVQSVKGASSARMAKAIELLRESDPKVQIDYQHLTRMARKAQADKASTEKEEALQAPAVQAPFNSSEKVELEQEQVVLQAAHEEIPLDILPQGNASSGAIPVIPKEGEGSAPAAAQTSAPQGGGAAQTRPPPAGGAEPISLPVSAARGGPKECCTCHRGPPGPEGPPGNPGRDGMDGEDGKPGDNGPPASPQTVENLFPPQCPCEAGAGDNGLRGPQGPAGAPGPAGTPGGDGKGGDNGIRGDQGKPGLDGKGGPKGPPGDDGGTLPAPKDIPAGPAGPPGKDGGAGPGGDAGKAGNPGKDGSGGPQGDNGPQGQKGQNGKDGSPGPKGPPGERGSCAHCPPPRLAPGY